MDFHLRVLSNASRSFWTCSCFCLCVRACGCMSTLTLFQFSPLFPFFSSRSTSSSSPHGRSGCDDIIAWEPAGWGHAGLNAAVCLSVCVLFMHADVMPDVCVNDRAALRWLVSTLVAPLTFSLLLSLSISYLFVLLHIMLEVSHKAQF